MKRSRKSSKSAASKNPRMSTVVPPENLSVSCQSDTRPPSGSREENKKIFNDPVHGTMTFDELLIKIIDTPEFQRLRYLKQLGGTYYVFPGASHNRFEHSLGVCFLAGEFVRQLQARQPELNITKEDILCIEIAGLCHDLGHGAFSHLFDMTFIPAITGNKNWKHEQASMKMFDHLVSENKLLTEFQKSGLCRNGEDHLSFIKDLINPDLKSFYHPDPKSTDKKDWPYSEERKKKSFLYEIVANQRNSLDVDKWDYFARDCLFLGIRSNFDHSRFMKFVRVIKVNGYRQICCRDKEIGNLYDMFNIRATLHRRAYQHKNTKIIEYMIVEVLKLANNFLTFLGSDGKPWKLSETIHDMKAYTQVHDGVLHMVRYSENPRLVEVQAKLSSDLSPEAKKEELIELNDRLKEARKLLDMIEKRKLYKCVGESRHKDKTAKFTEEQSEDNIGNVIASYSETLNESSIVVQIGGFDYGMKSDNPIDGVRFYSKSNINKGFAISKDKVSHMLLDTFSEQYIRVFAKDNDSIESLKKCFKSYCSDNGLQPPNDDLIPDEEKTFPAPVGETSGASGT